MLTQDLGDVSHGFMNPPAETDAGLGVFMEVNDNKFGFGAYNYMVLAHEFMHGLGLVHPHDDGGSSSIMDGVTDSFHDFDLNQSVYTAMS